MRHIKGVTFALHRHEVMEVLTAFDFLNQEGHWHGQSSLYYVKPGSEFPFHGYMLITHLQEAVGIIRQVEDYP